MAPTDKKRALLLCGSSLLILQLMATPIDLADDAAGLAPRAAHAQEVSCFAAGTLVLMANGGELPIEAVRPGDTVLGRRGRVNRVVAIERTPLGRRRLYAFNGQRPFVTAEHPFLTSEGWKALDPEATRRENDRLHVASLQLGDRICRGIVRRFDGGRAGSGRGVLFLQSVMLLEALAAVNGDPQTPLFNLLLDGDHSYVADGWIVHNKDGDAGDGTAAGDSEGGAVDGGRSDGGSTSRGGYRGSDGGNSYGGRSDRTRERGGSGHGGYGGRPDDGRAHRGLGHGGHDRGSDGSGSNASASDSGGSQGGSSDEGSSDSGSSGAGGSDGSGTDAGGPASGGSARGGSDAGGSESAGSDRGRSDGDRSGGDRSSGAGRSFDDGDSAIGGEASDKRGSPATAAAPAGEPASGGQVGGATAAGAGAAAAFGAAALAQAGGRKPASQAAQAKSPSARSALESFLQKLGLGDPSDAGLEPKGAPLSREQEQRAIKQRWRRPD